MKRWIIIGLAAVVGAALLLASGLLFPAAASLYTLRPFVYACTDSALGLDAQQMALLRRQNYKMGFIKETASPDIVVTDALFAEYLQAVAFDGIFALDAGSDAAVVPQGTALVGGSIALMGIDHEVVGVYTPHPLAPESRIFVAAGGALDAVLGEDALIFELFLPASQNQLGTARMASHLLNGPGITDGWHIEDYSHSGKLALQWKTITLQMGAVLLAILAARCIYGLVRREARRLKGELSYITAGSWIRGNARVLAAKAILATASIVISGVALRLTDFDPYIPAEMLPPRYLLDLSFYLGTSKPIGAGTPLAAGYAAAFSQGRTAYLLAFAGFGLLFALGLYGWCVWEKRIGD